MRDPVKRQPQRHLRVWTGAALLCAALASASEASRPPARPPASSGTPSGEAPAPARSGATKPSDPPALVPNTEVDPLTGPPLPAPRLTGPPRRQRGVALGLFAEDVSFSYDKLLEEIAALGATHVALIVPLYQDHGASTSLYLHTRFSPSLDAIANAVRAAQRHRLEVTLFPIVRLLRPRGPNEWRGTLAPEDPTAWFASYGQLLGSVAAVGGLTGATRLVIGSELSTLDGATEHWQPLLDRVRAVFSGPLVYSANWDHYKDAPLLDLVDEAGVTGYFDLRKPDGPSDVESLTRRWRELRTQIEAWARPRQQPWTFTELGYRSRAGATATPWDENPGGAPDPQEQARGFEAFRRAFAEGSSSLAGLYIWNWYGHGGPGTTSYTPRGKPAADAVRRLLLDL